MKKFALILFFIVPVLAVATNGNYVQENRKKITTDIVNSLVSEDYDAVRKNFHSTLKTALPVEKISEVWTSVITASGAFKEILSTSEVVVQGYNQVKIRCKFENENATVEATFNEDDKVIGLYIKP